MARAKVRVYAECMLHMLDEIVNVTEEEDKQHLVVLFRKRSLLRETWEGSE